MREVKVRRLGYISCQITSSILNHMHGTWVTIVELIASKYLKTT